MKLRICVFISILWALQLVASKSSLASELSSPVAAPEDIERARKRLYPGGKDEEDLKVIAVMPEAPRKMDEKLVQKEVYKTIYNQEMVDEGPEESESETTSH